MILAGSRENSSLPSHSPKMQLHACLLFHYQHTQHNWTATRKTKLLSWKVGRLEPSPTWLAQCELSDPRAEYGAKSTSPLQTLRDKVSQVQTFMENLENLGGQTSRGQRSHIPHALPRKSVKRALMFLTFCSLC